MSDPLLRPALEAFFSEQVQLQLIALLRAVRQPTRDTMKEARIAGAAEAYENCLLDLEAFARKKLEEAKQ